MDNFVSVDNFVDRVVDGWEMREPPRVFYPNQNCPIYDNILTVARTPAIQETVYLILVFQII